LYFAGRLLGRAVGRVYTAKSPRAHFALDTSISAMNTPQLKKLLQKSELAAKTDAILKHARPSARIIRGKSTVKPGASRLNNAPELPGDFEWPDHERGPYRFLAQFNLAELPKGMPKMPSAGLLSLFYQYDEDGETFWGDPGFVIARFFRPDQRLVKTKQPKQVDIGDPISITFEAGVDLPNFSWMIDEPKVIDWPVSREQAKEFERIRDLLHEHEDYHDDYLFGYPTNHTLAYDPTPGTEWQSLLTLGTDENLSWYFHDGDRLVTFVETKKMAKGDFAKVHADAG
jgi:uncharacterized protein YwqG